MKKRDEMIDKLEEDRLNKLRMALYVKQQQFDAKVEQKRIKALRKVSTTHADIQRQMDKISRPSFGGGKHGDTRDVSEMIDKYYHYNSEV